MSEIECEYQGAGVAPAEVARAEVARAGVAPAEVARAEVARAGVAPAEVARAGVAPAETRIAASRRVASAAFAVVLLAVEAVIVAESYRGLVGFAHMIGIHGVAALGVPVSLDGVSLAAAAVALRAELAGEASGLYRAALFTFTAASGAANWYHGARAGGSPAALYLGGMSLAVAWVFALSLRQIRHESRRSAGTVTERLPHFSAMHWARYPGLTWRAWSLAVRDGHTSPRVAIDAARASASGTAEASAAVPAVPVPASGRPRVKRTAPGPRPAAVSAAAGGGLAEMRLADAIRAGLAEGVEPRDMPAWLAERGRPGVKASRVYDVVRREREVARGRLAAV